MAWRIPKIHSCCCGCSLITGSKLIGFFHTFVYGGVLLITIILSILGVGRIKDLFLIMMEFSFVSQATFSIFLLYGLYRENYIYVLPWVLLKAVEFIASVLSLIFLLFLHLFGLYYADAAVEFIAIVLDAYFLLVVYNCYRSMREERDFPTSSTVLPF